MRIARLVLSVVLALGAAVVGSGGTALAATSDAPDSIRAITASSPRGTSIWQTLDRNTDLDYYRFVTTRWQWVRVTLGSLPADYSLCLFNGAGAVVGCSTRSGVQNEEVFRHLPAGTWYVRVMRQSGVADTTRPYELRFMMYGVGFYVINTRSYLDEFGRLQFAVEVLNTNDYEQRLDLLAQARDKQGNVLARVETVVLAHPLAPYNRAPGGSTFYPVPAGYDHTTFTVLPQGGYPITRGVTLVPGPPCPVSPSSCTQTVAATNHNSLPVQLFVTETTYNLRGQVQYVGFDSYPIAVSGQPPPPPLQPGQTATLYLQFPHFDGVVRVRYDYSAIVSSN